MARLSFQGIRYVAGLMRSTVFCPTCQRHLREADHARNPGGFEAAGRRLMKHFRAEHAEVEKQVCAGVVGN